MYLVASASSGNAPSYVRGNTPRGPIKKGVLSEIRTFYTPGLNPATPSAGLNPAKTQSISVKLFDFVLLSRPCCCYQYFLHSCSTQRVSTPFITKLQCFVLSFLGKYLIKNLGCNFRINSPGFLPGHKFDVW